MGHLDAWKQKNRVGGSVVLKIHHADNWLVHYISRTEAPVIGYKSFLAIFDSLKVDGDSLKVDAERFSFYSTIRFTLKLFPNCETMRT